MSNKGFKMISIINQGTTSQQPKIMHANEGCREIIIDNSDIEETGTSDYKGYLYQWNHRIQK